MKLGFVLAPLIILFSTLSIADVTRSQTCERAGITRIVELQNDGRNGLPCRVVYKKPMEDQSSSSLWNAQSDIDYCAEKYDAFITKIETKHGWSCAAEPIEPHITSDTTGLQTAAKRTITTTASPKDSSLPVLNDATAEYENSEKTAQSAENSIASLPADPTERVSSTPPAILSALPKQTTTAGVDEKLSMTLIRQSIPSGHYIVDNVRPHSGNTALCPAGGFFIWNTKQPTRPSFEMGSGGSFQFNLTGLTDKPTLGSTNISPKSQCTEKLATGYCSEKSYVGSSSLPRSLSQHFGCGAYTRDASHFRKLVLYRNLNNDKNVSEACQASPPHHMALASSKVLGKSDKETIFSPNGIELVILPRQSSDLDITRQDGAICRYMRG